MTRPRHRGAWLLAMLLAVACGDSTPPPPAPPEVTVAMPERRDVRRFVDFTGTTRAVEYAEIRARVAGTLTAMHFTPTSLVEPNQLLFEIERDTYQAAYDEAIAQLASAHAQLAQANADLERVEQAAKSRAVSQQDLDIARTRRDQGLASVMTAKARIASAATNLGYTRVKTPIAGQVGRNLVDIGNLVGAGEPTLLTTVTKVQPIYVYFHASERVVLTMLQNLGNEPPAVDPGEDLEHAIGQVRVGTAATRDFPHRGAIDFVDNTVDPTTGTIEVRAVLPNDDQVLFPGLFVRVRAMSPEPEEALLVEERGIGTDIGGKYVLVLGDENVVEQRYVQLGQQEDDGTIVVEEGLEGNERYIVNGLLRARPGFPVTPETAAEADAKADAGPSAAGD